MAAKCTGAELMLSDANSFRKGDIWLSSRGTRYTVLDIEDGKKPGQRRQAVLRNMVTQAISRRDWDAIGSFDRGAYWVREYSAQDAAK